MSQRAPLLRTIVVPVDGSELSDRIFDQARRLLVVEDARVVLLRVIPPEADPAERAVASAHLERLRAGLDDRGVTVTALLVHGDPAQTILDVVKRERASLVLMATHGRSGPSRWVRGSVAERVLRECPVPLFLANPKALAFAPSSPGELRFQRVLVPLDGSALAAEVLPSVAELARAYEAPVTLLRVGEVPIPTPEFPQVPAPLTPEELGAALEGARRELLAAGVEATIAVAYGGAAHQILAEAERTPETLLVMATHGRTGGDRWLFGSTAESVLRACACPVLVHRVAGKAR